jgi:hypothetical protein
MAVWFDSETNGNKLGSSTTKHAQRSVKRGKEAVRLFRSAGLAT